MIIVAAVTSWRPRATSSPPVRSWASASPRDIANALRADGLSTLLGGVLSSFPYTCFAQNVGLVRLTRVKSAGSSPRRVSS